jgi:hypothetical protein
VHEVEQVIVVCQSGTASAVTLSWITR